MKRRPPRSTRTDTLFPYTTLFRSTEFMIRGRGYLRGPADLSGIVLKATDGTPVRLSDVARVEIGPDERRGITELNGEGEGVSGPVVQRFGENGLSDIANAQAELAKLQTSLPDGLSHVPGYDRRSEERRLGKAKARPRSYRGAPV